MGESAYDVEIKIREDDIIYMKCSCPYAASGQYCKHMAAVKYASVIAVYFDVGITRAGFVKAEY